MKLSLTVVLIFILMCSFQEHDDGTLSARITLSQKENYSYKEMSGFFDWLDSVRVSPPIDSFSALKNDPLYKQAISNNLRSGNQYRRAITYRLIELAKDTTFNDVISKNMFSDDTLPAVWAYMALTQLSPRSTDIAFNWLMRYEDFSDAHSLPAYFSMDTMSIINTSYNHLEDTFFMAKILSLQTICLFDKTPKADSIARSYVSQWKDDMVGYAIVAVGFCNKGNYKELFRPLIRKKHLKETIIQTLEKSPKQEDQDYARSLRKNKKNTRLKI